VDRTGPTRIEAAEKPIPTTGGGRHANPATRRRPEVEHWIRKLPLGHLGGTQSARLLSRLRCLEVEQSTRKQGALLDNVLGSYSGVGMAGMQEFSAPRMR
jgi:hypothetical protein